MWISKIEYESIIERGEEFKHKMYRYQKIAQGLCKHEKTIEVVGLETTFGNGKKSQHLYTQCLMCDKVLNEEYVNV